jgi:hypothetical protein
MKLLCIDPGSIKSAWLVFDKHPAPGAICQSGIYDNEELLRHLRFGHFSLVNGEIDKLLIEQIKSYGNVMGDDILKTVYWSGRFIEAAGLEFELIPRKTIVTALCNTSRAKDTNVRAALIDLWGGKAKAIGSKKTPGPLYNIKADVWSALAVAVVGSEMGR